MKEVEIYTESITLSQFLKWIGIAQTGGGAKLLIQQGLVTVNGKVQTKRGKILRENDIVGIKGYPEEFIIRRKVI
ncbi:MAG: RNA-binding S4 domain-containing protein [bacterium]